MGQFLSKKELAKLEKELRANIYLCTKEIIAYVKANFKIKYSISGMTNLLHRIGFSYKKPDVVPGKADAKKQKEFKSACMSFFDENNLSKYTKELRSLLTENFQIVSA